jgi:hypothetical protein
LECCDHDFNGGITRLPGQGSDQQRVKITMIYEPAFAGRVEVLHEPRKVIGKPVAGCPIEHDGVIVDRISVGNGKAFGGEPQQ